MMRRIILLGILALCLGPLAAQVTWPEPLAVCSYDNVEFDGKSIKTADGCHFVSWKDWAQGPMQIMFQLFDAQYQPMWDQPLALGFDANYILNIVETSDSCFVVTLVDQISLRRIIAVKISRDGDYPWGPEGINLYSRWYNVSTSTATVADLLGGVYVAQCGERFTYYEVLLQHLDSEGNLTMPDSGVWVNYPYGAFFPRMLIQPDNSVVLSWIYYEEDCVRMNRYNTSGQPLWPQTIDLEYPGIWSRSYLCGFDEDSFILGVLHDTSLDLHRFSTSGTEIWPQPVLPFGQIAHTGHLLDLKKGSDNCIQVALYNYDNSDFASSAYFQKVTSDGVILFPGGINIDPDNHDIVSYGEIIPDDQGGATIVVSVLENDDPVYSIEAIRINSAGAVSVQQITSSVSCKEHLLAHAFAENIHLEWYDWNSEEGGIRAQILNNQLQPMLQEDGLPLRYGNRGLVGGVQTAAHEEGCATIWQYNHSETYYWDELRVQFFDLSGQPLFPSGGIRVNRPGSRLSESNLIRSDGENLLVLWGERLDGDYTTRAQIYNGNGFPQLADGGVTLFSGTRVPELLNATYHDGDWYVVWANSYTVWGQKISNNQLLWGNGLELTSMACGAIEKCELKWPWLIWKYGGLTRVKPIDPDGNALPGISYDGITLPTNDGDYHIYTHNLMLCEDNLHLFLSYSDPDIPTQGLYKHALLGTQGEYIFGPTFLTDWPTYASRVIDYNAGEIIMGWYRGWDFDYFFLYKFDTMGELLMEQAFPYQGRVVAHHFLANGDLLLIFDTREPINMIYTYFYKYLTPDWQLVTPADSQIGEASVIHVSMWGDYAWIGLQSGWHYGKYTRISLQCVYSVSLPDQDEDAQMPDVLCVEGCYPNPFNPNTSIVFSLPRAGLARLSVYDLRGRRVRVLLDREMPKGRHTVLWDGTISNGGKAASGIYIIRLESASKSHSRKITLVK